MPKQLAALSTHTHPQSLDQASVKPRQVVVALYDYVAQSQDEISFSKGDRLTVLNDDDANWLWASLRGSSYAGFIPRTMVEDAVGTWLWGGYFFIGTLSHLTSQNEFLQGRETSEREAAAACKLPPHLHRSRWLYGAISRAEAEEKLQVEGQTGSFLIRQSTKPVGDYSLSFR